jgi:hypothetical protein
VYCGIIGSCAAASDGASVILYAIVFNPGRQC